LPKKSGNRKQTIFETRREPMELSPVPPRGTGYQSGIATKPIRRRKAIARYPRLRSNELRRGSPRLSFLQPPRAGSRFSPIRLVDEFKSSRRRVFRRRRMKDQDRDGQQGEESPRAISGKWDYPQHFQTKREWSPPQISAIYQTPICSSRLLPFYF
jgi:hypothetical protein